MSLQVIFESPLLAAFLTFNPLFALIIVVLTSDPGRASTFIGATSTPQSNWLTSASSVLNSISGFVPDKTTSLSHVNVSVTVAFPSTVNVPHFNISVTVAFPVTVNATSAAASFACFVKVDFPVTANVGLMEVSFG